MIDMQSKIANTVLTFVMTDSFMYCHSYCWLSRLPAQPIHKIIRQKSGHFRYYGKSGCSYQYKTTLQIEMILSEWFKHWKFRDGSAAKCMTFRARRLEAGLAFSCLIFD
jgi:hypothetical protein